METERNCRCQHGESRKTESSCPSGEAIAAVGEGETFSLRLFHLVCRPISTEGHREEKEEEEEKKEK